MNPIILKPLAVKAGKAIAKMVIVEAGKAGVKAGAKAIKNNAKKKKANKK